MKIQLKSIILTGFTGALCTLLISGCQFLNELGVLMRGSSFPRNQREKVIFDEFQALRERSDRNDDKLPTRISIGEETKIAYGDDVCAYHYIVYASYPRSSVLISGEVVLHPNPQKPDSCQVGYNSAFGI